MSFVLIGHKNSGKTYLGNSVAEKLSWNFIDTDALIEKKFFEKTALLFSCSSIYKQYGELYFRDLEKECILNLKFESERIIAVGGGSTLDRENLTHLKTLGKCLFLNASISLLKERFLLKKEIPAYFDPENLNATFDEMLHIRQTHYKQVRDLEIAFDTDQMGQEKLWQAILLEISFASQPLESPMEKQSELSSTDVQQGSF